MKVVFLRHSFDCARAHFANTRNCVVWRCFTKLNEKSCRYRSGATEPSLAMNENVLPVVEQSADLRPC
jgi:hypothetical protein